MKGNKPISFESYDAVRFGDERAAIMFQHIRYHVVENQGNERVYKNGKYWMFKKLSDFRRTYPYLTERKIRTVLSTLEKKGVIETGNFNEKKNDHTVWYTLTNKYYFEALDIEYVPDEDDDLGRHKSQPDCQISQSDCQISQSSHYSIIEKDSRNILYANKQDCINLISLWNESGGYKVDENFDLIHKLVSKSKKKKIPYETLKSACENYLKVLRDKKYWYDVEFGFQAFLGLIGSKKDHWENFAPDNFVLNFYLDKTKSNIRQPKEEIDELHQKRYREQQKRDRQEKERLQEDKENVASQENYNELIGNLSFINKI